MSDEQNKLNKMEIDVIDQIQGLLKFESDDDFYYLQILQRKKENPQIGSNSRVIKNYYIKSIDHLLFRYEEIKQLCKVFNARAMLRLNKRSFSKVAFKTIVNVANSMHNQEYSFIKSSYDRACGDGHNDKNKKWIVDIDGDVCGEDLEFISTTINSIEPLGKKIICYLPTKNGVHLITSPFNVESFKKSYPMIDIHKDNPINLFIP